jgi:hypothetical protein
VFRRHTFESPLSRAAFVQQLHALVAKRVGFFGARHGRLYGDIGDGRFALWTPGSTRAHVVRILGSIEDQAQATRGTLRVTPEPMAIVPLVLIVLLAIASQWLADSWVRLLLPAIALVAIANFIWQAGVEWRLVAGRLQRELQSTISHDRS